MAYVFPGESADLDVMLGDSLHMITVGGVTKPCFYDSRGELGEATGGGAAEVLRIEVATIKADHFPGIEEGTLVTIAQRDGWTQEYSVVRIMPSGPLLELLVQRRTQ